MEFFFLFILNIFTGAVIYLILSLKMERTSSTFHEQKLRKEMGEIITEFNATAERNITLLENKINILKKLMGEQSVIRGVDFTVDDEILPVINVQSGKKGNKQININDFKKIDKVDNEQFNIKVGLSTPDNNNILVGNIDKISNLSNETSANKKIADYEKADIDYNPEKKFEDDIALLFNGSEDKYSLISELYKKGHSIDDISRYSGLPQGEIRLVISLNR